MLPSTVTFALVHLVPFPLRQILGAAMQLWGDQCRRTRVQNRPKAGLPAMGSPAVVLLATGKGRW